MTAVPDAEWRAAFVDTETTGLNPNLHPIWETAVVVDGAAHVWQTKLTNIQLGHADPYALELNGFHERYDPDRALTPRASVDLFVDAVRGRHLIGAIPSFDEERIRRMYVAEYGWPTGKFPWHYRVIDVEAMAVGWLAARGITVSYPWVSDELAQLCGIEPAAGSARHSALVDAMWAHDWWLVMQP